MSRDGSEGVPRGSVGPSDVARILAFARARGVPAERILTSLGFEEGKARAERRKPPPDDGPPGSEPGRDLRRDGEVSQVVVRPQPPRRPTSFWRVTHHDPRDLAAEEGEKEREARPVPTRRGAGHAARPWGARLSLVPWSRLIPRLLVALEHTHRLDIIDVPAWVRSVSRGEMPVRVPLRQVHRWPQRIVVWLDRSPRLRTILDDQIEIYLWLSELVGPSVDVRLLPDGPLGPAYGEDPAHPEPGPRHLDGSSRHLFVTDLGMHGSPAVRSAWERLGRHLAGEGVDALVLFPGRGAVAPFRWGPWRVLSWEDEPEVDPSREAEREAAEVGRLRRVAALFPAVTPGLLRALRRIPQLGVTGGVAREMAFYRSAGPRDRVNVFGLSFEPRTADRLRGELRASGVLAGELARGLGDVLRSLAGLEDLAGRPQNWAESVLALSALVEAQVLTEDEQARAAAILGHLVELSGEEAVEHDGWIRRFGQRTQVLRRHRGTITPALAQAFHRVCAHVDEGASGVEVPAGADLAARWGAHTLETVETFALVHDGPHLRVERVPEARRRPEGVGSPSPAVLAWLDTGTTRVLVEREAEGGPSTEYDLRAPIPVDLEAWAKVGRLARLRAENSWAAEVGEDEYGVWADAVVAGERFRMRWIPPGTFWMGSPEGEAGRWDDEGPVHEVTLTEGYWLADAPCTQALWTAVMGENPSAFEGADRPVERVSWDDVQAFLGRVDELAPGLELRLPTEAQWERACRAGTQSATYAGSNDPDALEAIAWYRKNAEGRTHPVRTKAANPWGLHDMLGNVDEWCQDFWRERYDEGPVTDPVGPERGTERVNRGGSWNDDARNCRAAGRSGGDPDIRNDYLGFRVSRGQAPGPRDAARQEPAERAGQGLSAQPRVVLSYRKEDAAGAAEVIREALEETLPRGHVFSDIEDRQPGERFFEVMDERLRASDLMLVVIGPAWFGREGATGKRRLAEEGDFVRAEIRRALELEKRVVPVLVGDAELSPSDLPDELGRLAELERFRLDAEKDARALVRQVLAAWRVETFGRHATSQRASLDVSLVLRTDRSRLRLEAFQRPAWAHGVGRDRFGLFAEVRPEGWPPEAWLKMRWISPGTFWMGSPESEEGRYSDEGPRHRVTLTEGFWLADAPCTQALWTTVMGVNPSHFQSSAEPWLGHLRPVERVSWDDVQVFLGKLQDALPGARLPTEAQWEYACRAGTETATYAGAMTVRGANDAPVLDAIAWYGGNSGLGYELDVSHDSSGWAEKQHPHERAGTREVRTKAPNPWGLYDMLGNVWEWCQDAYGRAYGEGHEIDPVLDEGGAERVFRGGSWCDGARLCRAAFRYGYVPDFRRDSLGFRVSRGQAPDPRDAGRWASGASSLGRSPGSARRGATRRRPKRGGGDSGGGER